MYSKTQFLLKKANVVLLKDTPIIMMTKIRKMKNFQKMIYYMRYVKTRKDHQKM